MLILIGPSASGKTEVAKLLNKKFNMTKIVTYTTRQPRIHEINGIDYNFISIEKFAKLAAENFFVETTYYNSNYYGTAKKDIQDDKCVILDPNGLKSFQVLNDNRIISIYLDCNEQIRYQRMLNRKDNINIINKRIINDRIAFNKTNIQGITYQIDSSNISLEDLAKKIFDLYENKLRKLK